MVTQTFILTPCLSIASHDAATVLESAKQAFGVDDLEMFQILPVTSSVITGEVVFKLKNSSMSLEKIEDLLLHNEQLSTQLERCQAVVTSMSQMLAVQKIPSDNAIDKLGQRLNKVEGKNKKLKQLLKDQLVHNECMRKETHVTIEAIKEEFSALIREIGNDKSRVGRQVKRAELDQLNRRKTKENRFRDAKP